VNHSRRVSCSSHEPHLYWYDVKLFSVFTMLRDIFLSLCFCGYDFGPSVAATSYANTMSAIDYWTIAETLPILHRPIPIGASSCACTLDLASLHIQSCETPPRTAPFVLHCCLRHPAEHSISDTFDGYYWYDLLHFSRCCGRWFYGLMLSASRRCDIEWHVSSQNVAGPFYCSAKKVHRFSSRCRLYQRCDRSNDRMCAGR
jgi:hypothetical protein